jgi:hypothetical protein
MSLIVEEGNGLSDADAYISLAFCTAYNSSIGETGWAVDLESPTSVAAAEVAIRKATKYLDLKYGKNYTGVRYSSSQALQWPRSSAYTSDGYYIGAIIPACIKEACAEVARRILTGTEVFPDLTNSILSKKESVGPISVEYAEIPLGSVKESSMPVFPIVDKLMVGSYGVCGSDGTLRIIRA